MKEVFTQASQPNTMHAFEILACGNPSHNLEVVCAPKPTTITQLLAMCIFSQSTSLCVCDARVPVSIALSFETCFSRPRSLQTSPQTSTTAGPFGADRGPRLYGLQYRGRHSHFLATPERQRVA